MTFHPPRAGEAWFHEDPWLDFEMFQSGHRAHNVPNYDRDRELRAMTPTKPVLEGEPCYEDSPVRGGAPGDRFDAFDVRKSAYWSLLAGACGHTYGNHNIWQFYDPEHRAAINSARTPWRIAIDQPGAVQLGYLQRFFVSLPWSTLQPDESLLVDGPGAGGDHVAAAQTADHRCALIYTPTGAPLRIDAAKLRGPRLQAKWFNPRDGTLIAGERLEPARIELHPPQSGSDWLLWLQSEDPAPRSP
jgi:hypothetical protein